MISKDGILFLVFLLLAFLFAYFSIVPNEDHKTVKFKCIPLHTFYSYLYNNNSRFMAVSYGRDEANESYVYNIIYSDTPKVAVYVVYDNNKDNVCQVASMTNYIIKSFGDK